MLTISGILNIIQVIILCFWVYILYKEYKEYKKVVKQQDKLLENNEFIKDRLANLEADVSYIENLVVLRDLDNGK